MQHGRTFWHPTSTFFSGVSAGVLAVVPGVQTRVTCLAQGFVLGSPRVNPGAYLPPPGTRVVRYVAYV
jgi:hypothetical protein